MIAVAWCASPKPVIASRKHSLQKRTQGMDDVHENNLTDLRGVGRCRSSLIVQLGQGGSRTHPTSFRTPVAARLAESPLSIKYQQIRATKG